MQWIICLKKQMEAKSDVILFFVILQRHVDVILSVMSFKQFSMQMWVHIQNHNFIFSMWNDALVEFWGWRLL